MTTHEPFGLCATTPLVPPCGTSLWESATFEVHVPPPLEELDVEDVELLPEEDVELVLPPVEDVELVLPPVEDVELVLPPVEDVELVLPPVEEVELVLPPVDDADVPPAEDPPGPGPLLACVQPQARTHTNATQSAGTFQFFDM